MFIKGYFMGGVESLIGSIFCFFLWWSLQVKLHSCTNYVFFLPLILKLLKSFLFHCLKWGIVLRSAFFARRESGLGSDNSGQLSHFSGFKYWNCGAPMAGPKGDLIHPHTIFGVLQWATAIGGRAERRALKWQPFWFAYLGPLEMCS